MKYLDGFRDPDVAGVLCQQINDLTARIDSKEISIMEVCGTHTMSISRYGIHGIVPDKMRLISGPGCPVCVTPVGYIDAAMELARKGCVICTFGDMLNVPGSDGTLALSRSQGAAVEVCYSPDQAIEIAIEKPDMEIVFLAVGFETTVAPVTSIIPSAIARGVTNISLLTAFKLVPPALEALMSDEELNIQGFLCPPHVSAITGSDAYRPVVEKYRIPCVVAGFEPLDILMGIEGIVRQLADDAPCVENQYSRVVKAGGNPIARKVMDKYLQVVDATWRGVGTIPQSGLGIRSDYVQYDAAIRHDVSIEGGHEDPACKCGNVIVGKITPVDCPLFGKGCTPEHPVGPCMVSSEGSCAAYFKYSRDI